MTAAPVTLYKENRRDQAHQRSPEELAAEFVATLRGERYLDYRPSGSRRIDDQFAWWLGDPKAENSAWDHDDWPALIDAPVDLHRLARFFACGAERVDAPDRVHAGGKGKAEDAVVVGKLPAFLAGDDEEDARRPLEGLGRLLSQPPGSLCPAAFDTRADGRLTPRRGLRR